jgi:hypothetical protein
MKNNSNKERKKTGERCRPIERCMKKKSREEEEEEERRQKLTN